MVVGEQWRGVTYRVKGFKEKIFFAKEQIAVLGMNVNELAAQTFEKGHLNGRVVDKGATLASSGHFAAHDTFAAVKVDVGFLHQCVQLEAAHIEGRFHAAFRCTLLDGFGIRASA